MLILYQVWARGCILTNLLLEGFVIMTSGVKARQVLLHVGVRDDINSLESKRVKKGPNKLRLVKNTSGMSFF